MGDTGRLIGPAEIAGLLAGLYLLADPPHLRPTDTAAHALRFAHCPACRREAHRPPAELAVACLTRGCGLCDPEALRRERLVLIEHLIALQEPNSAPPEAVEAFNAHLVAHRSTLAVLGTSPSGLRGQGFERSTLLQALHVAALLYVMELAGDRVHVNVYSAPTTDLQRMIALRWPPDHRDLHGGRLPHAPL